MNENDSLTGGDFIPGEHFILLPFYDEKNVVFST